MGTVIINWTVAPLADAYSLVTNSKWRYQSFIGAKIDDTLMKLGVGGNTLESVVLILVIFSGRTGTLHFHDPTAFILSTLFWVDISRSCLYQTCNGRLSDILLRYFLLLALLINECSSHVFGILNIRCCRSCYSLQLKRSVKNLLGLKKWFYQLFTDQNRLLLICSLLFKTIVIPSSCLHFLVHS